MRMSMPPQMKDVMRLVRSGALKDAVAAIQGKLLSADSPVHEAPPQEAPPRAAPAGEASQAPRPGKFESHAYTNQAGRRAYKLYVPAIYAGQPMPLVVMLHGCTQSPDDFAGGTQMNSLAEEHGFLVAYPGQAQSANSNKCWNWFERGQQSREQGEPSLIAGIANAVKARYKVDEARVYVAGLSSGGAMALTLAATYPDLFAAVGVHSGLAYGSASDMQSAFAAMRSGSAGRGKVNVPAIVFHGDRDHLVNPRNGDEIVRQWLAGKPSQAMSVETGTEGREYTRRTLLGESGDPVLEHWTIHGGGHAWSGGSRSGTHTEPQGPNASREMVRFFLANARPDDPLASAS